MIDAQVHVFVKENLPDGNRMEFARRAARSRLPYRDPLEILPRVGRGTWDPGAENLITFMDEAGIDIAVNAVSEFGPCFGEEAEWNGWEIHEHAYKISLDTKGRIPFMCGVDPRRHDAMQILEKSIKDWGAVGWQCFPANGYLPTDSICMPLYAKCLELNVPVIIRTGYGDIGPYTPESRPYHIEEVARLFRDLEIIDEHAGGGLDGLWRESLLVAKANPNVNLMPSLWQGTDLFGNERGPNRIQEFIKILHTFRESIGAHRILWGSDYMKGFDKQKSIDWAHFFQNLIQNAGEYEYIFSQDEIELMNQENAKRIYHLDN